MSLQEFRTHRQSVFASDSRATVLSLDKFLAEKVCGEEIFEENHLTKRMLTLVDRAFRHLAGNGADSSDFLLFQAMGGSKTHSMIALGNPARDPELRWKVLGDQDPAPSLANCRVVSFNARSRPHPRRKTQK